MRRTLVALTVSSLLATSASPQPVVTGHDMVLPCTQALTGEGDNSLEWMPMGFCIGVIAGFARAAPRLETQSQFCLPADTTREEQLASVVQYLENHAERLQEDFLMLAFEALRETWPCAKQPPATPGGSRPSADGGRRSVLCDVALTGNPTGTGGDVRAF